MFNKKCGLLLLTLLLLLVGVSGVCATDNNTDSLTTVGDNSLQLNNTSNSIVNLTNNYNYSIANNTTDLSTVPCAVSVYISVMESYNKTVDVETGIKETHTVDNITSVDGLVNAFTNYGLKSNVLKNNIENLKELHKDKKINIIVHMYIKNNYHYAHIKQVTSTGFLFNDNWFVPYHLLKKYYTNISIIITNSSSLNISCFGESVNKSEWSNITGKLTQRDLFNYNYGMVGKAINLNKEYNNLKSNIKDDDKKGIAFTEFL